MNAKLELRVNCDGANFTVPLVGRTRWVIGRAEASDICVADRRVSSEHAELLLQDGKLTLRRTTGQNPIVVNGKIADNAVLTSGASFTIGHSSFMVVAAQDGMNLIDTQTVLSSEWGEARTSSARLPAATSGMAPAIETGGGGIRTQGTSMRLLAQLFSLLTRAGDKESLAANVLDLACKRLNATRALLAKIENTQHLHVIASTGMPKDSDVTSLISTTVLKQIVDERQAVLIGNTAKSDTNIARQDSILRNHIQALACTPVFSVGGQLAAVLYVDNQDRPSEFSAQDAELLIWLGHIYSLLHENLEMRRRLEAEVSALRHSASGTVQMVAEDESMVLLLERVKKAGASEAAVLILGESGTGKEFISRLLHQKSPRLKQMFVARNCAAIPENLFESEMFGHKKGSFTGADSDRKGAFAEADGGTLFLDEIGDLDYTLQTKLLRAIQEGMIRPVGSDKDVPVNVRLVCATNKDLKECIRAKTFREDLYYRIATVTLTVPPLRDRRKDIASLARHFVRMFSGGTRSLTPAAEERLASYDWPGNVRELRSMIEQAVIFAPGNEIHPDELTLPGKGNARIDLSPQSLAEVERRHILQVLQSCNGNKTEAAKVLGLARSTLVLKLQSYDHPSS